MKIILNDSLLKINDNIINNFMQQGKGEIEIVMDFYFNIGIIGLIISLILQVINIPFILMCKKVIFCLI